MTRYEFAAGLNACLDRVNELIATATADLVTKQDLATLQRLHIAACQQKLLFTLSPTGIRSAIKIHLLSYTNVGKAFTQSTLSAIVIKNTSLRIKDFETHELQIKTRSSTLKAF